MGDASMPGGFFLVDLGHSIMFAALKETNCSHPMVLDRYLKIKSDVNAATREDVQIDVRKLYENNLEIPRLLTKL